MTATEVRRAYLQDLEAIAPFLAANDAGLQIAASPLEHAKRAEALQRAVEAADEVETEAQATDRIQIYLRAWRNGHLFVQPLAHASKTRVMQSNAAPPSVRALSESIALLSLRTFFPGAREPLVRLLDEQRSMLESRPDWILDIRGNDGGADTTYAPLLPWLLPDGWLAISERIFVTAQNLRAEETVCEVFAPGDSECIRITQETARRMRLGEPGGWVQQEYDEGWRHERPFAIEPRRPQRVLVLIDRNCGSSCEQFLLTIRQSFAVKLAGRSRTAGNLDASNLRPHTLPSGRRRLWYATTLSNRVPAMPVDGIGISPDILLPEAVQDELAWAQDWLDRSRR